MVQYIAKRRAPVRISQQGLDPFDAFLSLSPRSRHHDGGETIVELLNSTLRVIPLILPGEDSVLLATRLNLDWVMATETVDPAMICPATYWVTREERVNVSFCDGRTMDGVLQMELPPEINRPSDFLNGSEDFFPLVTRMGTLLVNKSRVRELRVLYKAPVPSVPYPSTAA